MMTKGSRILVLVSALALGLVYALPVWRIGLRAPQYPEGLGMVIHAHTIVGAKEHDLRNINNLNHYIGMKRIEPESIPELSIMPVAIAAFIALGLLVAALGRRWAMYGFAAFFLTFAVAGMVDFWKWEYDYGHDLDQEHAIIKIPGMSYQPPLIGSRQILNFTARSWPGAGGWILIGTGTLLAGLSLAEARRARRAGREAPAAADPSGGRIPPAPLLAGVALVAALSQGGCAAPEPRSLAFGSDACEACLMALADEGHGAEAVTRTGRTYVFDSIECMAGWIRAMEDPGSLHSAWVTDFSNPSALVRVEDAWFLASPTLSSPMGLGLTAFAREENRDQAAREYGGTPLDWEGVRALVAERWPDGSPAHAGHALGMR